MDNARKPQLWMSVLAAGLVATIMPGCNTPDPRFHMAMGPGFSKRNVTVSILGVYRKGRIDPAAWSTYAREITATLGPNCSPGFTVDLHSKSEEWASWLDTQTRQDGVTSDILVEIAPKAQGHFVLVFHLDEPDPKRSAPQPAGASNAGATPAGASPPVPTPTPAPSRYVSPRRRVLSAPLAPHVFTLGASVFSADRKDFVAEVISDSSSEKRTEAVEGFFERLHKLLPNATCAGWDWTKGTAHPPANPNELPPDPPKPLDSELQN